MTKDNKTKKKSKKFDSFSEKSLKKYINIIKKMRKKKVGKKKKKVAISNTSGMMNLLYNADKERKRKPRRNLLKTHPYHYPTLISDADVDRIWRGTKIKSTGKKPQLVNNMNKLLNDLYGFNLLNAPVKKPKGQRGQIRVGRNLPPPVPKDPPVSTRGRTRERVARVPQDPVVSDVESSSSSENEEKKKKRKYI